MQPCNFTFQVRLPPSSTEACGGLEAAGKGDGCCVFSPCSLVFLLLSRLSRRAYDAPRVGWGVLGEARERGRLRWMVSMVTASFTTLLT